MTEIDWKIIEYAKNVEVNKNGDFRNTETGESRILSLAKRYDNATLIIKIFLKKPVLGRDKQSFSRHRKLIAANLVYESFVGIIPKNQIISYKDGNFRNLSVENLALVNKHNDKRSLNYKNNLINDVKSWIEKLSENDNRFDISAKIYKNVHAIELRIAAVKKAMGLEKTKITNLYKFFHDYVKFMEAKEKLEAKESNTCT